MYTYVGIVETKIETTSVGFMALHPPSPKLQMSMQAYLTSPQKSRRLHVKLGDRIHTYKMLLGPGLGSRRQVCGFRVYRVEGVCMYMPPRSVSSYKGTRE